VTVVVTIQECTACHEQVKPVALNVVSGFNRTVGGSQERAELRERYRIVSTWHRDDNLVTPLHSAQLVRRLTISDNQQSSEDAGAGRDTELR